MSDEKLLRCPFCGAQPHYRINDGNGYRYGEFRHDDRCFFSYIGFKNDEIGELMRDIWNRRAQC
jgi:hypothetical protein